MTPRNPYYVLGLGPDATPGEIEREGRKILALIDVGSPRGLKYECALGELDRDATLVRESIAVLRDPKARAKYACLARLVSIDAGAREVAEKKGHRAALGAPFPEAMAIGPFRGL